MTVDFPVHRVVWHPDGTSHRERDVCDEQWHSRLPPLFPGLASPFEMHPLVDREQMNAGSFACYFDLVPPETPVVVLLGTSDGQALDLGTLDVRGAVTRIGLTDDGRAVVLYVGVL